MIRVNENTALLEGRMAGAALESPLLRQEMDRKELQPPLGEEETKIRGSEGDNRTERGCGGEAWEGRLKDGIKGRHMMFKAAVICHKMAPSQIF